MKNVINSQKWAYKFTNPTYMKFKPTKDFQQPQEEQKTSLFSRLRSYFSPPQKNNKLQQSPKRQNSANRSQLRQPDKSKAPIGSESKLKFIIKLTNEDILIGNEDQLDAICIGNVIQEFVDTEYLWSICINKAIHHVTVDNKKNYIIVLSENDLRVYQYKPKGNDEKPKIIAMMKLDGVIKFITVIREGSFALFQEAAIHIYTIIEEVPLIKLNMQKKFKLPKNNLKLLPIPKPFQSILNIFFQEISKDEKSFSVWNLELQFQHKQVKLSNINQVYQFPIEVREQIKFENYSKEIYFINLGFEIFMVKKGYIIDTATVNIISSTDKNYLRYISQSKLIHITDRKVQVYSFKLNINSTPPKILLQSTDSIQIPKMAYSLNFLELIELYAENFVIFYQYNNISSKLINGEIKYGFIITHSIKMEEKINNILPHQIKKVVIQRIEEQADMVNKMGLEKKDIYLRLWNNSSKTEVEDFKLLLDTLDYDTIKIEIEKKLKKNSMSYRQILLIEQGCLSMLSQNVFKPENTKQSIKNYMISHLFIRKLELYKQISLIEKRQSKHVTESQGKLLINIQNYNYYKSVSIVTLLYELIGRYINEDKDQISKIRAILRYFRFSLRIDYLQTLEQIINITKKKLVKLLQTIPEFLPYQPQLNEQDSQDKANYEGIWQEITLQQWEKSLYIQNLATMDNKENLDEVCSSVWFKRYWLAQHNFINLTKAQIQNIHSKNMSNWPFYYAIEKIFQYNKEYAVLRVIIDFIQDKYSKLPEHIYGKIFLYHKLFETFRENHRGIEHFSQFLQWNDAKIFKTMFNHEKTKKGFILKQMKPLYARLSSSETFIEGLLNYFASNLSQISDIKYLLNRMNNQKLEFHRQNQGIYEVLVRGMQLKLKLGSDFDIPVDQVLIYIQNIPICQNNPVFKDLSIMRIINSQSQRFKKMKLNMNLFQISRNMNDVLSALINYNIKEAEITQAMPFEELKQISFKIISDAQSIKQAIYPNFTQNTQIIVFLYLTKLLQSKEMVQNVSLLIKDTWMQNIIQTSQIFIENIVLYMYKWKFSQNPSFVNNKEYIFELMSLLPESNLCRRYIQAQSNIGLILSTSKQHVLYPLSRDQQFFTSLQLQNLLGKIQGVSLQQIDVQNLHKNILQVQRISSNNKADLQTSLYSLYEKVILRLIDCSLVKQATKKIKNLISLESKNAYDFIYPSLLIAKIGEQMVQQNKLILFQCASYLFKNPLKLLNIVEKLMSLVLTSFEQKQMLSAQLEDCKKHYFNYSDNNPILEKNYLSQVTTQDQKRNISILLKNNLSQTLKLKQQQFRKPYFYITYIILCNDPYVLTKFIYCIKYQIILKHLRSFFNMITRQEIFNKLQTLQFGKKMFEMFYECVTENKNIEVVIDQYRSISHVFKEIDKQLELRTSMLKKITKSIEKMRIKIKMAHALIDKRRVKGVLQTEEEKKIRIKSRLNIILLTSPNKQTEVIVDSDQNEKPSHKIKVEVKHKDVSNEPFDQRFQRQSLSKRATTDLNDYISIKKQKQLKHKYYILKQAADSIFKNLSIDKNIIKILERKYRAGEVTDAIRNSIRRSRKKGDSVLKSMNLMPQQVIVVDSKENVDSLNLPDNLAHLNSQSNIQSFEVQDPCQLEKVEVQEPLASLQIPQREQKNIPSYEEEKIANCEKEVVLPTILAQKQTYQQARVPELGNVLQQLDAITTIVNNKNPEHEQVDYNFQVLQPFQAHEDFQFYLNQLVIVCYNRSNFSLKGVFNFIKALSNAFPILKINKSYLEIYQKIQGLQSKFSLDLPLKSILPPQALFIKSQLSHDLFEFMLPLIIRHLNEEQLIKACKVITIAFKKSDIEHQIMFSYLIQLLKKFEVGIYDIAIGQKDNKRDIDMLKDKIAAVIGKIPVKLIKKREDQIMSCLALEENRLQIAEIIIESLKRRHDTKICQYFEQKYILKMHVS